MSETIEDCDVYVAGSYAVAISHGHRVWQKADLKARVHSDTGEVTFYIPLEQVEVLRSWPVREPARADGPERAAPAPPRRPRAQRAGRRGAGRLCRGIRVAWQGCGVG